MILKSEDFLFIIFFDMGCSAGALKTEKIEDSSILSVDNFNIQTVLRLNPIDGKTHKNRRNLPKNRGHSRSESKSKSTTVDGKRKSTRNRSERTVKTANDARITAKYDIKAVIGKGSYSRVLRVEHRITKQPYALKTIEAPGGREAFEAELSVLRRLNHPNVIKLIEVFDSSDKVYMVMELATGGSLLDRLESKGNLSEEDSREVMRMVLNGVKYLHTLGITHRDLKPDNLLYYHPGKDSKIMITDFSFASTRKPSGYSYMHTVCGTPQYVAPEIVARKPYTCAVDLWAVGVITYIVICGVFPFDADQDSQIFKLILKGKVHMLDSVWYDVSEEAKSFVRQLLQTDPDNRLSADQAMQHSWLTSRRLSYRQTTSERPRSDHRSQRSSRSVGSSRSGGSVQSLRISGHRRVQIHHLEALSCDPEAVAMM